MLSEEIPCVQQIDGASERKANRIYFTSDLMIGTPVKNSTFAKYP